MFQDRYKYRLISLYSAKRYVIRLNCGHVSTLIWPKSACEISRDIICARGMTSISRSGLISTGIGRTSVTEHHSSSERLTLQGPHDVWISDWMVTQCFLKPLLWSWISSCDVWVKTMIRCSEGFGSKEHKREVRVFSEYGPWGNCRVVMDSCLLAWRYERAKGTWVCQFWNDVGIFNEELVLWPVDGKINISRLHPVCTL